MLVLIALSQRHPLQHIHHMLPRMARLYRASLEFSIARSQPNDRNTVCWLKGDEETSFPIIVPCVLFLLDCSITPRYISALRGSKVIHKPLSEFWQKRRVSARNRDEDEVVHNRSDYILLGDFPEELYEMISIKARSESLFMVMKNKASNFKMWQSIAGVSG